jgi:ectoine hydroxylase-related dioxygenase (phytanoyl-CoA dioxygenase family)
VDGNYTLGFVLTGDHSLLTKDDSLMELTPGTIFLLHNRTKHAALRNETNKENIPLFFINVDFKAKNMEVALERVVQSLNHYKVSGEIVV